MNERHVKGLHVTQEAIASYAATLAVIVVQTDEFDVEFPARIETRQEPVEVDGVIEMRPVRRVVIEPHESPTVQVVRGVHEHALSWQEQARRVQFGEEVARGLAADIAAKTTLPRPPWEKAAEAAESKG